MSNESNDALMDQLAERMVYSNPTLELNPESVKSRQKSAIEKMKHSLREVSLISSFFGAASALVICLFVHIATLNMMAVGLTFVVALIMLFAARIMGHSNVTLDAGLIDEFAEEFHVDQTANIVASYEAAIGGVHQYASLLKEVAQKLDTQTAEDWAQVIRCSKAGAPIKDIDSYYQMMINLKSVISNRHSTPKRNEIMKFWEQF